MSYIKYSEIKKNKRLDIILSSLFEEIRILELQLIELERQIIKLQTEGKEKTDDFSCLLIEYSKNKEILHSLKVSFWNFSGKNPAYVLWDDKESYEFIDIFNPLNSTRTS